jgi:hypothetical protein
MEDEIKNESLSTKLERVGLYNTSLLDQSKLNSYETYNTINVNPYIPLSTNINIQKYYEYAYKGEIHVSTRSFYQKTFDDLNPGSVIKLKLDSDEEEIYLLKTLKFHDMVAIDIKTGIPWQLIDISDTLEFDIIKEADYIITEIREVRTDDIIVHPF